MHKGIEIGLAYAANTKVRWQLKAKQCLHETCQFGFLLGMESLTIWPSLVLYALDRIYVFICVIIVVNIQYKCNWENNFGN